MPNGSPTHMLQSFLGSGARARLVIHFLVHPDERLHVRGLQRHTGLGHSSLQRELGLLKDMDLVKREVEEDGRVYYVPNLDHEGWDALRSFVRTLAQPEEVIDEALSDVHDRIQSAFIYGSVAEGNERPDSDLDLFIVADNLPRSELAAQLMDAGMVIGRPVNYSVYDSGKFDEAWRDPSSYMRSVMAGAKRWVIGEEQQFAEERELAAAAV